LVEQAHDDGVEVELLVHGECRALPPGPELSLFRIVQESLTNVRKHAPGARATVRLDYSPRGIDVEVRDTGAARRSDGLPAGGHGLIGMRERVAIYGGTLDTGFGDGGGYRVHAHIPLEPKP
jgi:signal transduction histidine kinase